MSRKEALCRYGCGAALVQNFWLGNHGAPPELHSISLEFSDGHEVDFRNRDGSWVLADTQVSGRGRWNTDRPLPDCVDSRGWEVIATLPRRD